MMKKYRPIGRFFIAVGQVQTKTPPWRCLNSWRIQKDCNSHRNCGGSLSPAARTLGSNIHVAHGLIKNAAPQATFSINSGASRRIRTLSLLIRSQMLYPVKLWMQRIVILYHFIPNASKNIRYPKILTVPNMGI